MMLAVHIVDGVLSPLTLGLGFVGMTVLLILGCSRLRDEDVARTGVLTAVLFVATLIHPPIPLAKVHLLLNASAGILLGRHVGLAVTIALVLQALLLAHGGLYSIGVNTCTIGMPALVVALMYQLLKRLIGLSSRWKRWVLGGLLACVGVLGTMVLYYLTLRFGSVQGEDLQLLATIAFVWHIPVLVIEVLFTALLVDFLYKMKPELL
jgi:cobalt/nickel transport system permease protein